jgi:catechol-2,3-dioxygenase
VNICAREHGISPFCLSGWKNDLKPSLKDVLTLKPISIDTVQIQVEDFNQSLQWYQDILGLKIVALDKKDRYAVLGPEKGTCAIALYGRDSLGPSGRSRCAPAILFDDLAGAIRELKEQNVQLDTDISGGEEGFRWATIRDPEGNLLHLYEWAH